VTDRHTSSGPQLTRGKRLLLLTSRLWAWVFLGLMIAFFIITVPIFSGATFFSVRNSQNILVAITPVLLLGLGQTFVIISAGIDLSVGWVMSLASVVSAHAIRATFAWGFPLPLAVFSGFLAAVAASAVGGGINGTINPRPQVPALLLTLGASLTVRGGRLPLSENTTGIALPNGLPHCRN